MFIASYQCGACTVLSGLFQLTGRFPGRKALAVLFGLAFGHFHSAGIIGAEGVAALAGIVLLAG